MTFRLYKSDFPPLVNGRNPGGLNEPIRSFCSAMDSDDDLSPPIENDDFVGEIEMSAPQTTDFDREWEVIIQANSKSVDPLVEAEYSQPSTMPPHSESTDDSTTTKTLRPYYLTMDPTTKEMKVEVWPGAKEAGDAKFEAEVPEWVGERSKVKYPSTDLSPIEEEYPSTWVVHLDRRVLPRSQWPHTQADVKVFNRFSRTVTSPRLLFFDRHWNHIVWATKIGQRKSSEKFTIQVQRPQPKSKVTLTVGSRLGFKANGERNRNSKIKPCNVCDNESHVVDLSPCVMIIADSLPPSSHVIMEHRLRSPVHTPSSRPIPHCSVNQDHQCTQTSVPTMSLCSTPVKVSGQKRTLSDTKSTDEVTFFDWMNDVNGYLKSTKCRKAKQLAQQGILFCNRLQSMALPLPLMDPILSDSKGNDDQPQCLLCDADLIKDNHTNDDDFASDIEYPCYTSSAANY